MGRISILVFLFVCVIASSVILIRVAPCSGSRDCRCFQGREINVSEGLRFRMLDTDRAVTINPIRINARAKPDVMPLRSCSVPC